MSFTEPDERLCHALGVHFEKDGTDVAARYLEDDHPSPADVAHAQTILPKDAGEKS